jgi:hypothetical protein
MNTHVEDLIAYPHRHFKQPIEVLDEPGLSVEEKRRILESWKLDAQRLAESTAENMGGGEETDLRDVAKVLVQLNMVESAPTAVQPEQHTSKGVGTGIAIGAVAGGAAGLVIIIVTGPSLGLVALSTAVGAIIGGVSVALRNLVRA